MVFKAIITALDIIFGAGVCAYALDQSDGVKIANSLMIFFWILANAVGMWV